MTQDEVIEKARQLIDDEVLTRTGRSVGDLASGHVARALADAGLLVDHEQQAELRELRKRVAFVLGLCGTVDRVSAREVAAEVRVALQGDQPAEGDRLQIADRARMWLEGQPAGEADRG